MSDGIEVLAGPTTIWLGTVGTPLPAIDTAEADFDVGWLLVGTNGAKNYDESGVVISINETTATWTGLGGTLPMNAWREQEAVTCGFSIADLSAAQFALVLDDAMVTTISAGTAHAGEDSFSLIRGQQTHKYALLARGLSPEHEAMSAQYELARVFQSANQSPTSVKGAPGMLACEFTVLDDLVNGLPGTLRIGNAPKT